MKGHRTHERNQRAGERGLSALTVDAACVGLEILDLMVDDAPEILTRYAQDVASVLVRAGLGASAADAVDRLRRIASEHDRRETLQVVRSALRELDCGTLACPETEAGTAPGLSTDT